MSLLRSQCYCWGHQLVIISDHSHLIDTFRCPHSDLLVIWSQRKKRRPWPSYQSSLLRPSPKSARKTARKRPAVSKREQWMDFNYFSSNGHRRWSAYIACRRIVSCNTENACNSWQVVAKLLTRTKFWRPTRNHFCTSFIFYKGTIFFTQLIVKQHHVVIFSRGSSKSQEQSDHPKKTPGWWSYSNSWINQGKTETKGILHFQAIGHSFYSFRENVRSAWMKFVFLSDVQK